MSAIDNGGPAFPSSPTVKANGELLRPVDIGCEGITVRDYFAAKAMQGFCVDANYTFSRAAELAYGQADAMIKARGET